MMQRTHQIALHTVDLTTNVCFVATCYLLWSIAIAWNVVGGLIVEKLYY